MLEPIFATDPAVAKNDTPYKSGQNWLENNHLATRIKIGETDCAIFAALCYEMKMNCSIVNTN